MILPRVPNFSFSKLVSFIRFNDSSDPPSSSKFFLSKINVFPSFSRRILPRIPNSSFPKLVSLLYFYDSLDLSLSFKFFLSKTSVSFLLPRFFLTKTSISPSFPFFESSLEFQIRSFQKRMSFLHFYDSSDPLSNSKFFLSKTSVFYSFQRFFGSSLEFQILPFEKKSFFFKD